MTTATTTDRAADIRQTLKSRYGWSSRDVSVKSNYYSMGSSIDVTIKNPTVSAAVVEAVANGHESISRDQFTGEILSGGNRFVFVHYSSEALETIGAKYQQAVDAAIAQRAAHSDNSLIEIAGTPFLVGLGSNGWGLSLWRDSHLSEHNTAEGVAQAVGVLMLSDAAQKEVR